ncbi:hypothetical protein [Nannocystis exedens]|uniref:hypothetical protein n=1 Tax=Nannocystis exedens TaxID=54 RepID=UPI0011602A9D|nr:hypothetical protein [Nannocystis exedens]
MGSVRLGAIKAAHQSHKEVGADVIGEVLDGRYQLVRRLAKGGMAHVFLTKDRTRKCHVAIKTLRREGASARRRFELEAPGPEQRPVRAHRPRDRVRGDRGRPALPGLEDLEGETLSQRLAQGPLPWRDVARFGAQVSPALHVLHAAGAIQRDLKPDKSAG